MSTETLKCTQCNIVINELLCFVQNKIDVLDEESIVRLCVTAFSTSEISTAKDLLFASISTTVRHVSRRKNKEQKDLEDIICAFKNTEPDNTPIFVAWQIHKLPPVTFNSLDSTRVLKDIVLLQSEIKCIKDTFATNEQLSYLKSELDNMKFASLVNVDENVNKRRGACLMDSGPIGFLNIDCSPPTRNSTPNRKCFSSQQPNISQPLSQITSSARVSFAPHHVSIVSPHSQPTAPLAKPTSPIPTCLHQPAIATVQLPSTAMVSSRENNAVSCVGVNKEKSMAELLRMEGEWKPETANQQWIEVQRKRHRNRTEGITGKASIKPNDKFRPADIKIPLFISNVHKDTLERDIEEFIFLMTKEKVSLQKIKMKNKRDYNAFKVLVTRHRLETFLNAEIWPDGVTCRRFMPYQMHEQKRNFDEQNV